MMSTVDQFIITAHQAGLTELANKVRTEWLLPIYLLMIAFLALKFLRQVQWTQLLSFVGVAVVVGVLMFAGERLFGSNGNFTTAGTNFATTINMIDVPTVLRELTLK